MIQIDTKSLLLRVFIIIIPIISISTSVYLFLENKEVKGVAIKDEKESRMAPYISNILPSVAYVGEEYIFIPHVVSEDRSEIKITVVDSPDWLVWDGNMLKGIPFSDHLGSSKVVLNVSDRYNSSTFIGYILVNNNE